MVIWGKKNHSQRPCHSTLRDPAKAHLKTLHSLRPCKSTLRVVSYQNKKRKVITDKIGEPKDKGHNGLIFRLKDFKLNHVMFSITVTLYQTPKDSQLKLHLQSFSQYANIKYTLRELLSLYAEVRKIIPSERSEVGVAGPLSSPANPKMRGTRRVVSVTSTLPNTTTMDVNDNMMSGHKDQFLPRYLDIESLPVPAGPLEEATSFQLFDQNYEQAQANNPAVTTRQLTLAKYTNMEDPIGELPEDKAVSFHLHIDRIYRQSKK